MVVLSLEVKLEVVSVFISDFNSFRTVEFWTSNFRTLFSDHFHDFGPIRTKLSDRT